MKLKLSPGHIALGFSFFLFLFFAYYIFYATADHKLSQAYDAYQAGESAPTVSERERAFNEALQIYLELRQAYAPEMGTGRLDYNIANLYYQLGQYPEAVLYYNRALALRPGDADAARNLLRTYEKLGIKQEAAAAPFEEALDYFPLPRRLQFFFFLALAGFLILSWQIWFGRDLRIFAAAVFSLAAVAGGSALYSRYIEAPEAVVLEASLLRRDAGEKYAPVNDSPVVPGTKVDVLDVLQGGNWLKVSTPSGEVGYLPKNSLEII